MCVVCMSVCAWVCCVCVRVWDAAEAGAYAYVLRGELWAIWYM